MKKLVLIMALTLFSGMLSGQSIQKGTFIGTHVMTITLNPGVTTDEFISFLQTKLIPEGKKYFINWDIYLLKGIRGENPNSFGILYVVKSESDRDKFFAPDGGPSELMNATNEKMKPVLDEMAKLGSYKTTFTDWIVQ